jgi:hypothetical protein
VNNRHVWVDGWQMQCCGDPFASGSAIDWTTGQTVDREFLASFLGHAAAARFTDAEEHHTEVTVELDRLIGVVRAIEAVFCRYVPSERDGGSVLAPAAHSGKAIPRSSADGWEKEKDGLTFVGYAVTVDPAGGEDATR